MPRVVDPYRIPSELVLGTRLTERVPPADQVRQRKEVDAILERLRAQPGVILADEVGMGKTFVALGVAYSIAKQSPIGPVIVMVPPNLVAKWEQDLKTFCELYLENRHPVRVTDAQGNSFADSILRYAVAEHSVELLRLLDDDRRDRVELVFLKQGAMVRRQSDRWVRLALIAEALRTHGRGRADRLIQVKGQIHRFMAELLWAIGEERSHGWGDELWRRLLNSDPLAWKDIYNRSADARRLLRDEPVPKAVLRELRRIDLKPLARALEAMPVRARGGRARISDRLSAARRVLKEAESELWKELLARTRWRSPLLVMDEAHHLKNPGTALARTFRVADLDEDLRTGDGAMSNAFDRMLFLTATPFQLGHHELVRVLERFGDVRWDSNQLGERESFLQRMMVLEEHLNESQRGAIALQRAWSRLRPEDCEGDPETWWARLLQAPRESVTHRQRAALDAYDVARRGRDAAESELRPWVLRHNKGTYWLGTVPPVARRQRLDGGAIADTGSVGGLPIPPKQLLPFFLGARSAANPSAELLSEALCSSYEAFRYTREERNLDKDDEATAVGVVDLSQSHWYLEEFDKALASTQGATHPKIHATVQRAVDLWESGEKVLVFAFYRRTCRALRIHISKEIERRLAGAHHGEVESVQKRFFDDARTPGWKALDSALRNIVEAKSVALDSAKVMPGQRQDLVSIMRRFLRSETTLVRCFPFSERREIEPAEVVELVLSHRDSSHRSWREKFNAFIEFLVECSAAEREKYLEVASRIQTGGIRVEDDEEVEGGGSGTVTVANVQVATGTTRPETRERLMRAFNTPFLPDILVCSEVMGEGVDLQRACRHVIHHDLAWNPSTIEQRTGRIDRLGCKAEGRQSIVVYLPYLAGTADERQYQVMSHREQWFRVVMGQEEVAKLITPESSTTVKLPDAVSNDLAFKLAL